MRIGCFASGCCWGKITAAPWSVIYYNQQSVMPVRGIPVHPVQLYDAFLGLALYFFLKWANKNWNTSTTSLFLLLYPVGRFITEEFRGDSFRGENVFLSFSTSQTISMALFALGVYLMTYKQVLKRGRVYA